MGTVMTWLTTYQQGWGTPIYWMIVPTGLLLFALSWPLRRLLRWRRKRRELKQSWRQTADAVASAINNNPGFHAFAVDGHVCITPEQPGKRADFNTFLKSFDALPPVESEWGFGPLIHSPADSKPDIPPYGSKVSEDAKPVTRAEADAVQQRLLNHYCETSERMGALEARVAALEDQMAAVLQKAVALDAEHRGQG